MIHKRLLSAIAALLALATSSSAAWSQDDYRLSRGGGGSPSVLASYQNSPGSQPGYGVAQSAGGGNWVDSFAMPTTPSAAQPFQPAQPFRQSPYGGNAPS